MNGEDVKNLTQEEIEMMVNQLELRFDQLQAEYLQKKSELINDIALLRHRIVVDDVMKKLERKQSND